MRKLKQICTIAAIAFVWCSGMNAEIITGECGATDSDQVTWSFDTESGVLTIEGNGNMRPFLREINIPMDYSWNVISQVIIKEGVTNIEESAFSNCSALTSVTIPNSVTSIGYAAFGFCKALTSVTIPNSVTSIGEQTFYGCSGLTSVNIPNSVTSIDEEAFYGCSSLISINIPNSVTSIGYKVFFDCKALVSVYVNWKRPLSIEDAFYGIDYETCTLYCPKGTSTMYMVAPCRINFKNIEETFNEVEETLEEKIKRADLNRDGKLDSQDVLYFYDLMKKAN